MTTSDKYLRSKLKIDRKILWQKKVTYRFRDLSILKDNQ